MLILNILNPYYNNEQYIHGEIPNSYFLHSFWNYGELLNTPK